MVISMIPNDFSDILLFSSPPLSSVFIPLSN